MHGYVFGMELFKFLSSETCFDLILSFCVYFFAALSQAVDPALRRLCNAQSACRDCILASPTCTWCADPVSELSLCIYGT